MTASVAPWLQVNPLSFVEAAKAGADIGQREGASKRSARVALAEAAMRQSSAMAGIAASQANAAAELEQAKSMFGLKRADNAADLDFRNRELESRTANNAADNATRIEAAKIAAVQKPNQWDALFGGGLDTSGAAPAAPAAVASPAAGDLAASPSSIWNPPNAYSIPGMNVPGQGFANSPAADPNYSPIAAGVAQAGGVSPMTAAQALAPGGNIIGTAGNNQFSSAPPGGNIIGSAANNSYDPNAVQVKRVAVYSPAAGLVWTPEE